MAERLELALPQVEESSTQPAQRLGEEEIDALRARVERLGRRREQLGPVNPLAQEEYAEAVAHVEEMEGRRADLETALRELRGVIRDTDRQIQETFEETFQAAARNFEELVGDVFPGGSGRLRLVSEEQPARGVLGGQSPANANGKAANVQPLGAAAAAAAEQPSAEAAEEAAEAEAEQEERQEEDLLGVEIEITPAGKSTKRLSLLSGGEKSMTALAFLFAVFLARPCPFYILDEVEAALDDLNLDRFLALLRRYSDRAQFIVITHQKRTMEAADWLFGVSMGGDGVSKVLSRRLPAEQAADAGGGRGRLISSLALWRATGAICSSSRTPSRPRGSESSSGGDEQQPVAPKRGLFKRLRESMAKTRQALGSEIQATLFGVLDEHTWERLEEALIMADVGASTTASVVGTLEAEVAEGQLEGGEALSERLIALLSETARVGEARIDLRSHPTVIMAVGVNGTGKTTTIGKLAWHLRHELGRSVLLGAADTFRAAASEQLEGWAERAECEIVTGPPGSDPGAVAFEAIARARTDGVDVVIIDTAGRLHTQDDLMGELAKVRRVIARQLEGAPHETLLTIDATTGPERAAPGEAVRAGGRCQRRGADEARRHGARRYRAGDRARARAAGEADRRRRVGRGPAPVRLRGIRTGADRAVRTRATACRWR